MKAEDIINSESIPIDKRIKLLTSYKDEMLDTYKNNYKGKQEIKNRVYKPNPAKSGEINKIVVNLYRKITNTASYFLFGKDPELILNNPSNELQPLFDKFKQSYKDANTGKINRMIGRETLGYGQSAEILYISGGEVNYQFLSTDNNDLFPYYDEQGRMDAFTRRYMVNEINPENGEVTVVYYYDIYLKTYMRRFRAYDSEIKEILIEVENDDGTKTEKKLLEYDIMPIIYYKEDEPPAYQVIDMLDRYNLIVSNHADVNDYFSFPYLKLIGFPVTNESRTGESGQGTDKSKPYKNTPNVLHLDLYYGDGGKEKRPDAEFLTWSQKPESAIDERSNLKKDALYITNTPDLSLESLKGITAPSGVALELLFTDAIAQAEENQDIFNSLISRINVHKDLLSKIEADERYKDLDIMVEFKAPIPENKSEKISSLVTGYTAGIMSKETAVENNPYVENTTIELENIEKDQAGAASLIIEPDDPDL